MRKISPGIPGHAKAVTIFLQNGYDANIVHVFAGIIHFTMIAKSKLPVYIVV